MLGYPGEVSAPMTADHHNVCKFINREEPNYISLVNTLRSWITKLSSPGRRPECGPEKHILMYNSELSTQDLSPTLPAQRLSKILGVEENFENSLSRYRQREGTCAWLLQKRLFREWSTESACDLQQPSILWLTGLPGTGKSTLSSFLVNHLIEPGYGPAYGCQYHFFSSSEAKSKSVAYALRSIAFQLALALEPFRVRLLHSHEEKATIFHDTQAQIIWSKIFEGILFKMTIPHPLYFIFDAIDEADIPETLVKLILKSRFVSPVKIFFTSRPTGQLMPLANPFPSSSQPNLRHEMISEDDTSSDIKIYVQEVVRDILMSDEEFQEEIIDMVLTKASGSFLWVTLALETLKNNCHTQTDIKRALNRIPQGMEMLYSRMMETIKNVNNKINYNRAHCILTWAACSARPLKVEEMKVALDEHERFVNFEWTIMGLCGHFLTIRDGRVLLIHETARSFLFDPPRPDGQVNDSNIILDRSESHEFLAKRCLDYLSRETWKPLFSKIHENEALMGDFQAHKVSSILSAHPFLVYATKHWAYHVSHASVESAKLFTAVQNFFDRFALLWIHVVTSIKDIGILTRSAQYLKRYSRKSGRKSSSVARSSLAQDDTQFIELWAQDLSRLVGQYGLALSQKPSAIYKIIPPLCPRESMIYRTYARSPGINLSVAGLPDPTWDDSIARLTVGRERISKVLCTGSYIVCLVAWEGVLTVYYAETCEELRHMKHGEYVNGTVTVSETGSLAATAGVTTIKVWELFSGEQLHSVLQDTDLRTMNISFGNNDQDVILCREDSSVTRYKIATGKLLSKFMAEDPNDLHHSGPRVMALSPDLTKVALAFRGKPILIWDTTIPNTVQKPQVCIRGGDRATKASDGFAMLDTICWHPDGLSLLALYQDTTIVHYDLPDEEQVEKMNTSAREMVINRDGSLLLTFEPSGVIVLWSLPRFERIYQLRYSALVRDMCFSPDSQRFYDARGNVCNVWQPDILMQTGDNITDDSSTSENLSHPAGPITSTKTATVIDITALAPGPESDLFYCGRDDGTVSLCDLKNDGRKIKKVYSHTTNTAVTTLASTPDGKLIASGDESGRVLCKKVLKKYNPDRWAVFPSLEFRLDYSEGPVIQLLFNQDGTLLFVHCPTSERIWDIKSKALLLHKTRTYNCNDRWQRHPTDAGLILKFETERTHILTWKNLSIPHGQYHDQQALSSSISIPEPEAPISSAIGPSVAEETEPSNEIRQVLLSSDNKFIICEILVNGSEYRQVLLEVITAAELRSSGVRPLKRQQIDCSGIHMERFFGIYRDDIIFLDTLHWICSFSIYRNSGAAKRHFPIPKHWISTSALPLLTLLEDGTLLFPNAGEVVIFRGGLRR